MEILYAPWRTAYSSAKDERTKKNDTLANECVFCNQFAQEKDEEHFILKRTKRCVVMMNLYPYNQGHLLILPLEHAARLDMIDSQMHHEIMDLITLSCTILEQTLGAQGFNVGINLGKNSGAGIPSHLHWHVLPRWAGDSNFISTIGQTRVYSFDIKSIYADLKRAFDH